MYKGVCRFRRTPFLDTCKALYMKRILAVVAFLVSLSAGHAQQRKPQLTMLTKVEYDFGNYHEKVPRSVVFVFRNTGDAPLVVGNIETSCGCTTAKVPRRVVRPGMKGYVRVYYSGNGFLPGNFKKTVNVSTNAAPQPLTLTIRGNYFPLD